MVLAVVAMACQDEKQTTIAPVSNFSPLLEMQIENLAGKPVDVTFKYAGLDKTVTLEKGQIYSTLILEKDSSSVKVPGHSIDFFSKERFYIIRP